MNILPTFIVIPIFSVIAVTEIIKRIDRKQKLRGFYVFIPAILSLLFAGLLAYGRFFDWHQLWFWAAVIFSLSVFSYESVLKKVSGLFDFDE